MSKSEMVGDLSKQQRLDLQQMDSELAWRWRLSICDPAERSALESRAEEMSRYWSKRAGAAVYISAEIDYDAYGKRIMRDASPEGRALRIELGLPAEPVKVPTEEERILAEVGDGYMTPAQRKRLRYLRKHNENG